MGGTFQSFSLLVAKRFVDCFLGCGCFYGLMYILSVLILVTGLQAQPREDVVRIYTSDYPPYSYKDADGNVVGVSTEKVRAQINATGLNYTITIVPWSRALLLLESNPNSLVFSLDRTPDREEKYHWLFALNTVESHLIGRVGLLSQGFAKEEAVSGAYNAVCSFGSSSCELLQNYGFPEEAIFAISARSTRDLVTLLTRNRADFVLEDPNVVSLATHNKLSLKTYDVIEHGITDYLAASKSANTELIKRIKAVYK